MIVDGVLNGGLGFGVGEFVMRGVECLVEVELG